MTPVVVMGVLETGGDVLPPPLDGVVDDSLDPPPPPHAERLAMAAARRAGRNTRWTEFRENAEVIGVSSDP
jgi:hypothetical protein